jgi:membrane-associated PAP2 superfamily phosphatase
MLARRLVGLFSGGSNVMMIDDTGMFSVRDPSQFIGRCFCGGAAQSKHTLM